MIDINLQLPEKTENSLRRYVRKQFGETLEEKLKDVLIQWIGKVIKHVPREKRRNNFEED